MKIKANGEEALEFFRLADDYKRCAFLYGFLALCCVGIYYFFSQNILLLVNMAICIGSVIYLMIVKKSLAKNEARIDDCYIEVEGSYLNCYQLYNGKYEEIRYNINDITKIIESKEGVQVWVNENSPNSRLTIDDQIVQRGISCISTFGYSIEEYIDWYVELRASIPESVEVYENGQNWKKRDERIDTVKMVAPCLLFVVTCILGQLL